MNIFDDLHPSQLDTLLASNTFIGSDSINDDDSPIAIDSMISVQNGRLMFVSSIKIGTLVGLLETEDPRLSVEYRRQRKPDFSRIPAMAEYLHRKPWAYSAITVALSGKFQFVPIKRMNNTISRLGILKIPRGFKTRAIIIDGQHRFLSLRAALGLEPNYLRYALDYENQQILAEENISVIFYAFENDSDGINWSQQYFYDLNCLGISTSRSLGIKFDKRSPINRLTVKIADRSIPFVGRIELEERQCGPTNTNLFTLSALKNANRYLLDDVTDDNLVQKYDISLDYWNKVGEIFTEWHSMPGNQVRDFYVHGYGVTLSALGLLGKSLIAEKKDITKYLERLRSLDWNRWLRNEDNTFVTDSAGNKVPNTLWHGFTMNGSTIQNTTSNIRNTGLLFKKVVGLSLSNEEKSLLNAITAGEN